MSGALYDLAVHTFPNAEPFWTGSWDHDSLDLVWGTVRFVVTTDDDGEGNDLYLLGVYNIAEGVDPDGEPSFFVEFPYDAVAVVTYLDDLTELHPEGTDLAAWAEQWTRDAIADNRLKAEHIAADD